MDWLAVGGDLGHAYGVGDDDAFCANGVVSSDCTPHHHAAEVKKVYQPVKFKMLDPYDSFMVTNWFSFTNLNEFDISYTVYSNERTLLEEPLDLDLRPFDSQHLRIQRLRIFGHPGEEFFVRFSVRLKQDEPFRPAGTEIAYDNFKLAWPSEEKVAKSNDGKVIGQYLDNGCFGVKGENFQLNMDEKTGLLKSYKFDGQELITDYLKLNFWRAPTLNDEVDSHGSKLWRQAGLDDLQSEKVASSVENLPDGRLMYRQTLNLRDGRGKVQMVVNQVYLIAYNGEVSLTNHVEVVGDATCLPKVGMQMHLPKDFSNLQYFGKDAENYPDRNAAGTFGVYSSNALDLFEQHVVPQDNSNHNEVRWMTVESAKKPIGLMVTSSVPFNFSIYPYSDEQLTRSRRINQLNKADYMTLNVDALQAGLGTATCGPDVAEQYLITDKVFDFDVCFRPYPIGKRSVVEMYRYACPSIDSLMTKSPAIKVTQNGEEEFRIFNQPLEVTLSCVDTDAKLYYTLDGSEPTEKSSLYKKPFKIDSSCELSVVAITKGRMPSFTAHRCFERHYIKNTTFVNDPEKRYSKDADIALMDGKLGVSGDYSNHWLGFCGNDMEATIELTDPLDINVLKIGICHDPNSWVVWPKGAMVSFSTDGIHYSDWKMAEFPVYNAPDPMASLGRVEARAKVNEKNVKYLKVKVLNQGVLPKWHPYAGEKSWIMVDEVKVEN